jgi:hypothetical protein
MNKLFEPYTSSPKIISFVSLPGQSVSTNPKAIILLRTTNARTRVHNTVSFPEGAKMRIFANFRKICATSRDSHICAKISLFNNFLVHYFQINFGNEKLICLVFNPSTIWVCFVKLGKADENSQNFCFTYIRKFRMEQLQSHI